MITIQIDCQVLSIYFLQSINEEHQYATWPLRSVIIYLKLRPIINDKFNIRFSEAKLWNSQIK